jgi:outer membrane protein with beta-barrel domain
MNILDANILLVAALITLTSITSLQAQDNLYYYQEAKTLEFGPRIGFTTSMINSTGQPGLQRGIKLGLVGGVFARYQMANQWALHTDLSFSTRGNKSESGNFENSYVDFSIVPVRNVKYKMFGNVHTFDFFVGPGLSFLTKSIEKDSNNDTSNILSSTEFNIVVGGSLPFGSVLLTATNRLGMSNLLDNPIADSTWAGFTTEWTAAYRFK